MSSQRAIRAGRRHLRATVVAVVALVATMLPGQAAAADPGRSQQWAMDVIGAPTAHGVGTGRDVVIAVVDSGVDLAHEDLVDNLVGGIDLVDRGTPPQDEFGHGTHVAGIAAAVGGNGRGIVGVAPGARIMPVRVLDEDGTGSASTVSEGVRWAVDNGADVVNLSLGQAGQQVFGSALTEAIRDAWARGVVVVVAAGNEFVLSSGFGDEPALVVSATTRDDGKPDYSNGVGSARWGMAAPGGGCRLLTCPREDGIFSTYWTDGRPDTYAYLSGTSMAAPHVAGAAAVLLSLGLGPQETVDRLLSTAKDIGASGRDSTFGAGRLDLAAAVRGLGQAGVTSDPPPATDPSQDAAATEDAPGDTASPSSAPRSPTPTAPTAPTGPSASAAPSAQGTGGPTAPPSPEPSPTPTSAPTSPSSDATLAAEGDGTSPAGTGRGGVVLRIVGVALLVAAAAAVTVAAGQRRTW